MENEIRQKILEFVHIRPRAIAEISEAIKKNWRTADRYVDLLVSEDLVKTHVFRKGGRGALKIAYWPSTITETPSAVKNFLLQRILNGTKKEDFSALDLIQHIPEKQVTISFLDNTTYEKKENVENFFNKLKKAKTTIQFFSGNLSFSNLGGRGNEFMDIMREKLKEGVNIYALTRVDNTNKEKINSLLSLNKLNFKGKIQIRYAYQPLRSTLVDETEFSFKENFHHYGANEDEIKNKGTYIYYSNDSDWAKWLSNVFWHLWHSSIDAEKRILVLDRTINK